MTDPLSERFLSQLAPRLRAAYEGDPALAPRLSALLERAGAMGDADAEGFVAFVAQRVTDETTLEGLHAADLFLAFGCLLGDPEALARFELEVLGRVAAVVRGQLPAGLTLDEVLQRQRVRLLVRDGERAPGLATYSGRGSLVHWARTAAVRFTQEFARAQREVPTDEASLLDGPVLGRDLEVSLLRRQYAAPFAEAFRAALAELSPREQNLLRLHYLEGLRAEELGRVFDTHRTTVWRWLTQCRERLLASTRLKLAALVPEGELSSLMGAVHSQLDVSLSRVLGGKPP